MKKVNSLIFISLVSLSLIMTSCDKKEKGDVPVNEYTIKFVDYDNFLLSTLKVKEGTVPVYDGEEPYRDPTREYSYTFAGWTPELVAATADTTYKATYTEEIRKYTIRFVNDDGTELQKESLPYGSTPVYKGTTPTKDVTAQYTYTFENWDKPIEAVKKNATYTATYSSVVNSYQVTFDTHGGSAVNSQTVPYGGHVTKPSNPTKPATGDAIYVFEGWDFDFENTVVTGPTTINASWYEVDSSMPHGESCVYVHYSEYLPDSGDYGYKEFWYCPVHHQYVMSEPTAAYILEVTSNFDGEILPSDERYISLSYDENHMSLEDYHYGIGMYSVDLVDFKNFRIDFHENGFDCNLYSENNEFYLWRIDLPRINYTMYRTVSMDVKAPNWYQNNTMGPEADNLCYQTVFGGEKNEGKIYFSYKSTGLVMDFYSIEYADQLAFSRTITDNDIITGKKSAYFYVSDKWDRYLNISNISISTEAAPEDIYSYGGDTTKLSAENATVKLPGSGDYNLISKKYVTDNNALFAVGPDDSVVPAVFTLPGVNFDEYTVYGTVKFRFGVYNNGEHMYFGSGDSKIDLGTNNPSSQSTGDGLTGYVNWEMSITSDSATIHNNYNDQNYSISLTSGMRNGTERMVFSGGAKSQWRKYLFTDFYLYLD
ncbi:MAG: InlB B-repeat-containing protein [Bacilli bacterium]|nr:InlB B-repeat-containing protein [Bacilli bacterium]